MQKKQKRERCSSTPNTAPANNEKLKARPVGVGSNSNQAQPRIPLANTSASSRAPLAGRSAVVCFIIRKSSLVLPDCPYTRPTHGGPGSIPASGGSDNPNGRDGTRPSKKAPTGAAILFIHAAAGVLERLKALRLLATPYRASDIHHRHAYGIAVFRP